MKKNMNFLSDYTRVYLKNNFSNKNTYDLRIYSLKQLRQFIIYTIINSTLFLSYSTFAFAENFTLTNIKEIAQTLATKEYEQKENEYLDTFEDFNIDEWHTIKHQDEKFIWKDEKLPFLIEFFAPGYLLQDAIKINIIDKEQSREIKASHDLFEAEEDILENLPKEFEVGGFRILYPLEKPNEYQSIASFIGATFFRGTGRNGHDGVYARGVTINTALQEGEEFPSFTEVWIEKPSRNDRSLVMHALMDSPSMTGVFTFELEPGTSTIMNVDSVFYPRAGVEKASKIGIAPLASMFYFSKNNGIISDNKQEEAHSSDGLLYTDSENNWLWRPLSNPRRLSITNITDDNPKGFGLFQRNTNSYSYKNKDAFYHQQSSLWVEPIGDWGKGSLELIEIPTRSDKHNNIALFWIPQDFDREENIDGIFEISYSYKLYWISASAIPHLLGRVISTQEIHNKDNERLCTFHVDFMSESLNSLPATTGLSSVIDLPKDVELLDKYLEKNEENNGWRLVFTVLLPEPESIVQTLIPARNPKKIHFQAYLIRGENLPTPITELWQYDLTL